MKFWELGNHSASFAPRKFPLEKIPGRVDPLVRSVVHRLRTENRTPKEIASHFTTFHEVFECQTTHASVRAQMIPTYQEVVPLVKEYGKEKGIWQ